MISNIYNYDMAKKKQGKAGENRSDIVRNVPLACADDDAAVEFLEELRWGDTPCCPNCGSVGVYQMKDRKTGERNKDYRWRCRDCGDRYTVRTGTVMENTRCPLRVWCFAFWRVCSSKKGVAAKEIERQTGVSYKTALFVMHRVRYALADLDGVRLSGIVECDETYVGGKPRHKGKSKRGRGTKKTPVMGMVERGGKVHTRVVPDVTAKTLKGAIREVVANQSTIMTDELNVYRGIGAEYAGGHKVVTHSTGQYVNGEAHTNTAEGVFSLIKRGLYGVYHNVSKQHLHRYLAEFDFRYNTRELDDGERVRRAIKGSTGKRLMYREPQTA